MPLFSHFDPDDDVLFYLRFCEQSEVSFYFKLSEDERAAVQALAQAETAGNHTQAPFELWSDHGKDRHFFAYHPGSDPYHGIILLAVFRKAGRAGMAELRKKARE